MHELVEDGLQADSLVELLPGEGGGEEDEGCEVERVSVILVPLPHADS